MNFPANPTLNQTYTFGDRTWKWNGAAWEIVKSTGFSITAVGTGTLQYITLPESVTATDVMVFVNGLLQAPVTDYTVSSTTLAITVNASDAILVVRPSGPKGAADTTVAWPTSWVEMTTSEVAGAGTFYFGTIPNITTNCTLEIEAYLIGDYTNTAALRLIQPGGPTSTLYGIYYNGSSGLVNLNKVVTGTFTSLSALAANSSRRTGSPMFMRMVIQPINTTSNKIWARFNDESMPASGVPTGESTVNMVGDATLNVTAYAGVPKVRYRIIKA